MSSFLTVEDEAFAYLTIESNVNKWIEVVKGKEKGNSKRKGGDKTKWTGPGLGRNAKEIKRGWSLEGRKRYNELFLAVIDARKTKESNKFETNFN